MNVGKKRVHGFVLAFVAIAALTQSESSPQSTPAAPDEQVSLVITVMDRQNRAVEGLSTDNFRIYEDGQLQSIVSANAMPVPGCIGIVVDNSGSMRHKISGVTSAVLDLARARADHDLIFIVNFNDRPYLDADLTHDLQKVEDGLNRGIARGGTALYDAVLASSDHLAKSNCQKRVLLAVSDGGDNESRYALGQTMGVILGPLGPVIYALGLPGDVRPPAGRRALERLTGETGGAVFFVGKPKDMEEAIGKISAELNKQYVVTYTRARASSSTETRTIRVEIDSPAQKDIVVRTRTAITTGIATSTRSNAPRRLVP